MADKKLVNDLKRKAFEAGLGAYWKRYAEHGLGEPTNDDVVPGKVQRAIAEIIGFTPTQALQRRQINKGESGDHAGIRGDDPGGTKGWGLGQNTPGVWGEAALAYLKRLGGEAALRNPIKGEAMAKFLFDSAGKTWSPWYGTRYLDKNLKEGSVQSVLGKGASFGKPSGSADSGTSSTTVTPAGKPEVDYSGALVNAMLSGDKSKGLFDRMNELVSTGAFTQPGTPEQITKTVTKPGKNAGNVAAARGAAKGASGLTVQKDQNHGAKALAEFATRGIYGSGERSPENNAAVGGASGSDHLSTNNMASAVDAKYGTGATIAKRLGVKGWKKGNYDRHEIVVDGRRYSVQILEDVEGHYDHTHVGIQRVG